MRLLQQLIHSRIRMPLAQTVQPIPDGTFQKAGTDQDRKPREARQRLANAFTPARPLAHCQKGVSRDLSTRSQASLDESEVGRERIARALIEDRSHIVVFGERGRGKTCLANLVATQVEAAEFFVVRHVCSGNSNFDEIMRGLLHEMADGLARRASADFNKLLDILGLAPSGSLQPSDVLAIFDNLHDHRILMLVDESDRVEDEATRTAVADTIKQLSDRDLPILFMIVGASDNPDALLGRNPSIQRCVMRMGLPLLTQAQVEHLVACGAAQAGLEFTASARTCIAELARGLPYMAQLLLSAQDRRLSTMAARRSWAATCLRRSRPRRSKQAQASWCSMTWRLRRNATPLRSPSYVLRQRARMTRWGVSRRYRMVLLFGSREFGSTLQRGFACWSWAWSRRSAVTIPSFFAFTEALLPQSVLLRTVLSRQAAAEPAMTEVTEV
ncbi:ATP-binding protein [Dankookia sp. P2]|uniref:ATP-binding protein n=1 Tax=Dankookia sp. P2 TaxID=3423955 RepID=UPI003D66DA58